MRGRIIQLIGLDGCGKTTQAERLEKVLQGQGEKSIFIPLDTKSLVEDDKECIQFIRKNRLILSDNEIALLLKSLSIKRYFGEKILPLRNQGVTIIVDRYIESNYFFAILAGIKNDILDKVWNCEMLLPDINIWIDTPADICYARILERQSGIKEHEKLSSLNKALVIYKSRMQIAKYKRIDGCLKIDDVTKKIITLLSDQFS